MKNPERDPKWYESAVATQFVLKIGEINGQKTPEAEAPNSVLLNHQNPLDYLLGDAITQMDGRYFLLEFKQNEADMQSEWEKEQRRSLLETLSLRQAELRRQSLHSRVRERITDLDSTNGRTQQLYELSMAGHFMCYGHWEDGLELEVLPYAEAITSVAEDWTNERLEPFLRRFEEESPSKKIGLKRSEFGTYLAHLVSLVAGANTGDDKDTATGYVGRASRLGWTLVPFQGMAFLIMLVEEHNLVQEARAAMGKGRGR